jgi:glycerophosphoryl diester phosphodiesterase
MDLPAALNCALKWLGLLLTGVMMATAISAEPLVIAHRGASGYLPEHTLAAKAMAHAMGADFIEQDVVLTADGVAIVLHDIHLESTTDVEQRFPDRARTDGRFYAIDFSLAEITQLRVHERSHRDDSGKEQAVFEGRFPLQPTGLRVPTLSEEIDLISGLNRSSGKSTGLYIELKSPNWHRDEGQDIARVVLETLASSQFQQHGYPVFLQCFDDRTLKYLRQQLETELPLIQLIADNSWGEDSAVDYSYLQTPEGLRYIATYADGIGPWLEQIYQGRNPQGEIQSSSLVGDAQANGLLVHPYTFRSDQLPEGIVSFNELLTTLINELGVDGVFTDFPDKVRHFLDER